jgi:hypothetical protein
MGAALSPQVFLLEDEGPEPGSKRRWLHAHGLTPWSKADHLALAKEGGRGKGQTPAKLLYVDLDADGAEEALWLAGEELRAILPIGDQGELQLLTQAQTCERLAGRTDAALQPALSACAASAKRPGSTDGGSPPTPK